MISALPPQDEMERLAELRSFDLLDSAAEPVYAAITRLAAKLCGTPIALISLIDADRQ